VFTFFVFLKHCVLDEVQKLNSILVSAI
jgi:hypothetical protein